MKTWEMIKELTENPHKKFVAKYFKDEYFAYTRESMHCEEETYYDAIVLETEGEVWPLVVDKFTKGLEWEEVKKPVSFMEAVKSGKKIKVEHKKIFGDLYDLKENYNYLDVVLHRICEYSFSTEIRDVLLNGKWYIE